MNNESEKSEDSDRKSMLEWLSEEVRNNPSDTFCQLLMAFYQEVNPNPEGSP